MSIEVGNSVINSSNAPSLGAGLIANRPVKTGANSIYIAIDQKKIYQFVANAWVLIIDGSGGGGGGAVNSVTGTGGQIDAVNTAGAVVLSMPDPLITPGDVLIPGSLEVDGPGSFLAGVEFQDVVNFDNGFSGAGSAVMDAFVKNGGTAGQFLKANGSVDSSVYALLSQLAGYLPLTGGTVTGTIVLDGGTTPQNLTLTGHSIYGLVNVRNNDVTGTGAFSFQDQSGTIIANFGIGNSSTLYLYAGKLFFISYARDIVFSNGGSTFKPAVLTIRASDDAVVTTGNVISPAFVTNGGTNMQFVKGDGSLGSISSISSNNIVAQADYLSDSNITKTMFTYVVPASPAASSFTCTAFFEILSLTGSGTAVFTLQYTTQNGTPVTKTFFDGSGVNPPVLNVAAVSNYVMMGEIRALAGTNILVTFQASGAVTAVVSNLSATLMNIR